MSEATRELLEQGRRLRNQHRHAEAKAACTQALSRAREENEPAQLVQALARYGGIERDLGNIDSALQHYRQAVELSRTVGAPLMLAHTVRHVADILRESGQLDAAQPCYAEALEIYRTDPDASTLDLANTLRGCALLETAMGNNEPAIALWREAGALYNQVWQEPDSPFTEADLMPGIIESLRQIAQLSVR